METNSSASDSSTDSAAGSVMWSPTIQFGFSHNVIEKIILK
jgi:hypothetical protein